MSQPAPPSGRIRALYAAASGALETASFLVWALWILCVFFMVFFVFAAVAAIFD